MGRKRRRGFAVLEIDGTYCTPELWPTYSRGDTKRTGGLRLFRDLILNNAINYSLSGNSTLLELVEAIAKYSPTTIPVESLSQTLSETYLSRGRVVFGFPGNYLEGIARAQGLTWWISKNGLNIQKLIETHSNISSFDERARELMLSFRSKRPDRRLESGLI